MNKTRRFINFRVLYMQIFSKKRPITQWNRNRRWKYFRVWIRGLGTTNLCKKQSSKISCYCPFKGPANCLGKKHKGLWYCLFKAAVSRDVFTDFYINLVTLLLSTLILYIFSFVFLIMWIACYCFCLCPCKIIRFFNHFCSTYKMRKIHYQTIPTQLQNSKIKKNISEILLKGLSHEN